MTSRPGAKGPGARERTVEASKIAAESANRFDDFTYTVVLEAPPARVAGERRDSPRRRTRLRSGKVVDPRGAFVTECLVHDVSGTGCRLRLPEGVELPTYIHVYDDQSGRLHRAEVLWRKGTDAGMQFVPYTETARSRAIADEMRRKFYRLQR